MSTISKAPVCLGIFLLSIFVNYLTNSRLCLMSFQMREAFSQLCTIIQNFSYCSAKASSKPGLLPLFLFIKQLCWGWLCLVKFKEKSCQNYERGSRGEWKCLSPHREWEKGKWQPLVQDAINNQFGTAAQETAWLALSSLLLPYWVYYVFNPLQRLLREEAVSARRPLSR